MADFIDEYGEVLSGRAAFLLRQKQRNLVIEELRREWEIEKDRKAHPYKYFLLFLKEKEESDLYVTADEEVSWKAELSEKEWETAQKEITKFNISLYKKKHS